MNVISLERCKDVMGEIVRAVFYGLRNHVAVQADTGVLVDHAASVLKVEVCSWSIRFWYYSIDQGFPDFLIIEAPHKVAYFCGFPLQNYLKSRNPNPKFAVRYTFRIIANTLKLQKTLLTLRLLMSYIYMERLFLMFLHHTQRRTTVGRTPLDE